MNVHTPTTPDRLDDLVQVMASTIAAEKRADLDNENRVMNVCAERRASIEVESSWLPCHSAAGALLKLVALKSRMADVLNDPDSHSLVAAEDEMARQIGSLTRWLEAEFGVTREEYGLEFYHSDDVEAYSWGLRRDAGEKVPL